MTIYSPTRREFLIGAPAWALATAAAPRAFSLSIKETELPHARPAVADRHFSAESIEKAIKTLQRQIADPALRILVENCLPNTLDTTVFHGTLDGHPDTYVVTGDIDAMWLRDSSAQVWPYLAFVREDDKLRALIEGVVRRQTRMILIDPYANAFTRDPADAPLSWAVNDKTDHHPGVAERKWEVDSLCYPIRLAHGYWKSTGDGGPFDAQWKAAAETIVRTFREQQIRLSVEVFNVLNTNRFNSAPSGKSSNPLQTDGTSANFGTYIGGGSALLLQPRQMQFSAKYVF